MKTIKITTHWSADQALCVCELLDELKSGILTAYSDEIEQLMEKCRIEQADKQPTKELGDWFDDEIPF